MTEFQNQSRLQTQQVEPLTDTSTGHLKLEAASGKGKTESPRQLMCLICLVAIDHSSNQGVMLDCPGHHNFHKSCVTTWLQRANQCPICRQPPSKLISISDKSEQDLLEMVFIDSQELYKEMAYHFNSFMVHTRDSKQKWLTRIDKTLRIVRDYMRVFYNNKVPTQV